MNDVLDAFHSNDDAPGEKAKSHLRESRVFVMINRRAGTLDSRRASCSATARSFTLAINAKLLR